MQSTTETFVAGPIETSSNQTTETPTPMIFSAPPPPPPPPGMGFPPPPPMPTVANRVASLNAYGSPLSELDFIAKISKEKITLDTLVDQEILYNLDVENASKSQMQLKTTINQIGKSQRDLLNLGKNYSKSNLNLSDIHSALLLPEFDSEELSQLLTTKRSLLKLVLRKVDGIFSPEKLGARTEDDRITELNKLKERLKSSSETLQNLQIRMDRLTIELQRLTLLAPEPQDRLKSVSEGITLVQKQLEKIKAETTKHQASIETLKMEIPEKIKLFRLYQTRYSLINNGLEADIRAAERKLKIALEGETTEESTQTLKKDESHTPREQELIALILNLAELTPQILVTKTESEKTSLSKDKNLARKIYEWFYSNLTPVAFLLIKDKFPDVFSSDSFEDDLICQELSEKLLKYSILVDTTHHIAKIASQSPFPNQAGFRKIIESITETDLITGDPITPEQLAKLYPSLEIDKPFDPNTTLDHELLDDLGLGESDDEDSELKPPKNRKP